MSKLGWVVLVLLISVGVNACAPTTPYETWSPGEAITPSTLPQSKDESEILSRPTPSYEGVDVDREDRVYVGVLLPLSGEYASLGKSLFQSAQMALFDFRVPHVTLRPYDTKGTSFGAVAAFDEAIADGAHVILGPVFSKLTKAIVPKAKELDVPVISFSNDKTLENSGVFAMGFLPDQQVERVVSYALEQGIKEFAAIFPNNSYGGAAAKELRTVVATDEEAIVLKSEFYRTNRRGEPIKLRQHVFAAYDAAVNTRSPKDYDEELQAYNDEPIVYPRGLLIPEGIKRVEQIVPLLEKYNFSQEKVQLIGSSQWYNEAILAYPMLEGAWFALLPKERKEKFIKRYVQFYDVEPVKISSLAYDAMALILTLAKSQKQPIVSEMIANPRGFIGVDGMFRFKQNGLVERGLAIMKIEDGTFVLIDPAPTVFKKDVVEDNQEQ